MTESLKQESKTLAKAQHMGRGGARPGAGRPKGKQEPHTLEKLKVKAELERRIRLHAQALFNAQVSLAMGEQYLFKRYRIKIAGRTKWSRFERVMDPEEMREYLDGEYDDKDTTYYMLTAEKPDARAIDSLLDRAFGKAAQSVTLKDEREDPIGVLLEKFGLLEEGNSAGQTEGTEEATS